MTDPSQMSFFSTVATDLGTEMSFARSNDSQLSSVWIEVLSLYPGRCKRKRNFPRLSSRSLATTLKVEFSQ